MSTIQVKLLNDGGYGGGENVKFPVVVKATKFNDELYNVNYHELVRVGFDMFWDIDEEYPFYIDSEIEVMS